MCGIAGQLFFDRERVVGRTVLNAMCQALFHRGPDDNGIYHDGPVGLASTRLSIIDVTSGHMPMSNRDGSVVLVYNGEVYNFQRLRRQLQQRGYQFQNRSDTEVILHLYEELGEDFAKQLNGMFAVAIWDKNRRQLLLARDHVGIKPLFFAQFDDRLVFGSEIKALLAAGVSRDIDTQALHDYLSLNYVPGPRTMFRSVRKLLPGQMLVARLDDAHVSIRTFWDRPEDCSNPEPTSSHAETEKRLEEILRSTIRDTMVSDVPIGAFLSGGIDSSIVVAMMSEFSDQPVKTFSVGFDEESYSELPYARLVAKRFATDHHEILLQPRADELITSLADCFDEPFGDNSAIAVYAVSRLAAQHVKVALSGDGGDEVFGGYYTYQADKLASAYRLLPQFLRTSILPQLVQGIPTSFRKTALDFKLKRFVSGASNRPLIAHYSWKAYLSEDTKAELYAHRPDGSNPFRPTYELFQEHYDSYQTGDLVNRMLFVDSKIQLADDMLTKVDRMSMAHSLEVRVPLLNMDLVNFMFSLPGLYKVRGLKLKYLLKRIAARRLPPTIINRPKAGFTVPLARWVSKDVKDLVADQLAPQTLRSQGFFDPAKVWAMLDDHWTGRCDYARSIWTLVMFGMWWDRYVAPQPISVSATS
jgi:asparagine synthase (glutamine-hydrolysing)